MIYCVNCENPVTRLEVDNRKCSHCGKDPAHEQKGTPPHLVSDLEKITRLAIRLQEAESLLKRAYDGMAKAHWQEGESEAEVCDAIRFHRDNYGAWK